MANALFSQMLRSNGLTPDSSIDKPIQSSPSTPSPAPVKTNTTFHNFLEQDSKPLASPSGNGTNDTFHNFLKQDGLLPTDTSASAQGGHLYKGLGVPGAIADALQTAIDKKMVPKGVLNDAALGIGMVQGWCGVYAGKISTASNVGDYWNQKIATANKTPDAKNNIQAGYKIVVPYGVTKNKDGSYNGYGHVVVGLTNPDSNGNVLIAQSNADGRQNRGEGPGVATYGILNINDLNKRYGNNWGAIPGTLKVNPYKQGNTIPVQAQPNDNGSENAGNWVTKGATGLLNFADKFVPSTPQKQQVTNDQAPPLALNIKDPKVLADYVVRNNITDLQNKQWWNESKVKGAAWDLIQKQQGKSDVGARFTVDQNQSISTAVKPQPDILRNALGIMGFSAPALQQAGELTQAAGGVVRQISEASKKSGLTQFLNPVQTVVGDAALQGVANSLEGAGSGFQDLAGTTGGTVAGGLGKIVFGVGGLTGGGAVFNTAVNLPIVKDVADKVFGAVEGFNNTALDAAGIQKGEFRDFLNLALQVSEFSLAHKALVKGGEIATTKNVRYTPEQMKAAFSDITTGKKSTGVTDAMRKAATDLLNNAAEGVKQKEVLRRSYREGVTIKQARDFTGWFNKFFKSTDVKTVTPEFQKLLTDGKAVESGKKSPIEFTNEARDVMARGESATLRDKYENGTALDIRSSEANLKGADGKTALEVVAQEKARLTELQQKGAVTQVQLEAGGGDALKIQTYTASDHKVSVGYTVETDAGKVLQPMVGKYDTPQEAVRAVVPQIEKAIGNNSDIASEAIRTKLTDLEQSKFSEISTKKEVMPWEDNYTPEAKTIDTKTMTREEIQGLIDKQVQDYVDNVLKPTGYKGVTQGGISRDVVTGEVVGRQGRISNNPEWYREAVKANGGSQPTVKQLKEIAVDHLLNGVKDDFIGDLPANPEFKKLTQALATAKAGKVSMTEKKVGEVKGTGEKRVRGLALSVEEKAVENNLTSRLSALPEYKTVNMAEQATKAQKLVQENPELARKIAFGEERPPADLLPESVFVAVENDAIAKGDIATITALARESGLTTEATTMGQRLRALAERDPESPVGAFESVIRAREQELERRLASRKKQLGADGKKVKVTAATEKAKVVEEIKQTIKKSAPKKADWNAFIQELTC